LTGRFQLRGQTTDPATPEHRRHVYWCGPGAVAFDHLRPDEFYGFLLGLYPRFDTVAAQELALELGLAPFMGKRLREMSTGTQRKVWLSAAFSAGTPVVLLDEPLNALDMRSVRVVRERLLRCTQDVSTAWIVVSHEGLGEAEAQARTVTLPEPAER
jgi:ABC-type multidrug transport system ATPase subunit